MKEVNSKATVVPEKLNSATIPPDVSNPGDSTDNLSREGLVRGNRVWNVKGKRGLLDMSRSSFLAKVKTGELPVKTVKLGKRTTAYRLSEILSI